MMDKAYLRDYSKNKTIIEDLLGIIFYEFHENYDFHPEMDLFLSFC